MARRRSPIVRSSRPATLVRYPSRRDRGLDPPRASHHTVPVTSRSRSWPCSRPPPVRCRIIGRSASNASRFRAPRACADRPRSGDGRTRCGALDRRWLASALRPSAATAGRSQERVHEDAERPWNIRSGTPASRMSAASPRCSQRRTCSRPPAMTTSATDLLRQLIYLPNAAVLVADARRVIVGAAVLALRPSVSGGGHGGDGRPPCRRSCLRGCRRGRLAPWRGAALGPQQGLRRRGGRASRRSSRSTTLVRPRLRRGRSPHQARPDACGRGARSISRARSGWRSSGALSAIFPAHRMVARAYRRLA